MSEREGKDNGIRKVVHVETSELQARLPELLQYVEGGETVAIMREGKTVAYFTPDEDSERAQRQAVWNEFMRRRATWKKTGMTTQEILDMRHEGHRF